MTDAGTAVFQESQEFTEAELKFLYEKVGAQVRRHTAFLHVLEKGGITAEDIIQDVALKVARYGKECLKYLARVTHNILVEKIRRQRNQWVSLEGSGIQLTCTCDQVSELFVLQGVVTKLKKESTWERGCLDLSRLVVELYLGFTVYEIARKYKVKSTVVKEGVRELKSLFLVGNLM